MLASYEVIDHNLTTVFATALVSNATEDTYVWLLENFMVVMNGKAPSSAITDGDLGMKKSINRVFSQSYHRLCAWHMLHNATSNVGIPYFMPWLKKCMFGDYDVVKFEELWDEMVMKFGLEDNAWIRDLYAREKNVGHRSYYGEIFRRHKDDVTL